MRSIGGCRASLVLYVIFTVAASANLVSNTTTHATHAMISDAIAAAASGDVLIVSAGTYTEPDIQIDKNLTIIGQGASNTIIQAATALELATERVLNFPSGTSNTIEGLTIRHGDDARTGSGGGGIRVSNGSLQANDCIITDNKARGAGGGLCSQMASVSLDNCRITSNETTGGGFYSDNGGGLFNWNGAMSLVHCTVSNNSALIGGGVHNYSHDSDTTLTMSNCVITANTGSGVKGYGSPAPSVMTIHDSTISFNSGYSGGVMNEGGLATTTLNGCTINDNKASLGGAGVHAESGSFTLSRCTLSNNTATNDGAGIYAWGTTLIVNNCMLDGNRASRNGGGVFSEISNATLNNCTVAGNNAAIGGGITNKSGTVVLNNCIVAENSASAASDDLGGVFSATNSCSPTLAHGVNGCITNSPQFANATNGDYRLGIGSPCIDAGANSAVTGTSDLDGTRRISNGVVDMGAYEFFVPSSGTIVAIR